MKNFVWLDDTDFDDAQAELSAWRAKLNEHEWVKWSEADYPKDSPAAFDDLQGLLMAPSMFCPGKVVLIRGLPKCQAQLADALDEVADNVLCILVARPDTRTTLYKKAAKAQVAPKPLDISSKGAAFQWLMKKAQAMGIDLDVEAGKMLVDFVGKNPNVLAMELKKLKHLSLDGRIYPWVIQQGCCGTGAAEVTEMMEQIKAKNFSMVHEFLDRLLDKGEEPLKLCGFLMSWARRMALAEACNGNYQAIKPALGSMKKFEKPQVKAKDSKLVALREELAGILLNNPKKAKKIKDRIKKEKEKMKSSSAPLFPNTGAIFHACQYYNSIRGKRGWAYDFLCRLGRLQYDLRRKKMDDRRLMHFFFIDLEKELADG